MTHHAVDAVRRKRGRPRKVRPAYDATMLITPKRVGDLAAAIAEKLDRPADDLTEQLAYAGLDYLHVKAMREHLPRQRRTKGNRTKVDVQALLCACAIAVAARNTPGADLLPVLAPRIDHAPDLLEAAALVESEIADKARQMLRRFGGYAEDARGEPEFVRYARAVLRALGQTMPGSLRGQAQAAAKTCRRAG